MADAYTVFWTMDRWLAAVAVGHKPLPVLFGGPHLSEPSFRRAGVKVGDSIFPIAVSNRKLYVVARMRVREMLLLGQEDGPSLIDQRFPQYRSWKFLAPTCTEEVIVGMEGSAPRADLEVQARPARPADVPVAAGRATTQAGQGWRADQFAGAARDLPALRPLR